MEFTSLNKPSLARFFKSIETQEKYSQPAVKFKASVGIVIKELNDNMYILLGKCAIEDDRKDLWCFPGGGIEQGENPYQACIREVKEESQITVIPTHRPLILDDDLPGVAFIETQYQSGEDQPNHEFEKFDWFNLKELPDDIFPQNLRILKFWQGLPVIMEKDDFLEEHEKLLKVLKKKDEFELDDELKEQSEELKKYQ
jgi:dATP pyrophosphohydrolase